MDSYKKTTEKFLTALNVDSIKDVKYLCKDALGGTCVCGQPLIRKYKFLNVKNGLSCCVGKECMEYVTEYLCWKKKKYN